jgi:hypothetical protein
MKSLALGAMLLLLAGAAHAAPVVYTNEASFAADVAALGVPVVQESFEDDVAWADSRNSIVSPGSTPSVVSQGIVWTSNDLQNELATGTVGGSAPDGAYAIYSLPHGSTADSGLYCDSAEDPDIPPECFQNDGLAIASESGAPLYAFGGRIDTASGGKVTFLLDGVDVNGNDTDNIDNWQREGDLADGWAFVGVIDTDGFQSAELRELKGKDFQQVLLFADEFTVALAAPACDDGLDNDGDGAVDFPSDPGCLAAADDIEDPECQDGVNNDGDDRIDFDGGESIHGSCSNGVCPLGVSDPDQDGVADADPQCVDKPWQNREGARRCGLGGEVSLLVVPALWLRRRRRSPSSP